MAHLSASDTVWKLAASEINLKFLLGSGMKFAEGYTQNRML